jgi:hypothetical protein
VPPKALTWLAAVAQALAIAEKGRADRFLRSRLGIGYE